MHATYISIIAILFCVGAVKSYISNYDRRYIYDKKYIYSHTAGILLLIIFIGGSVLDFHGYIDFIKYSFPLWGIAPTLQFYGIRRLIVLKIQNNNYISDDIKHLKKINDILKTIIFCTVLLLILYVWLILEGKI